MPPPLPTLPPKISDGVLEEKRVMRDKGLFAPSPVTYNSFWKMGQPEGKLLLTKAKGREKVEVAGMGLSKGWAPT